MIPSKEEDKEIKKLLAVIKAEEKKNRPIDYSKYTYQDGTPVKSYLSLLL